MGPEQRQKRDITCASVGHTGCDWSCKLRGWKKGGCSWNNETGAFDCQCSAERRGIRCHVGGENVCHASCLLQGHTGGECDKSFSCNCSGENSRLGNLIEDIAGRF